MGWNGLTSEHIYQSSAEMVWLLKTSTNQAGMVWLLNTSTDQAGMVWLLNTYTNQGWDGLTAEHIHQSGAGKSDCWTVPPIRDWDGLAAEQFHQSGASFPIFPWTNIFVKQLCKMS